MLGGLAEPSFAKHREFPGTIEELYQTEKRLKRSHPIMQFTERTRAGAEFEQTLDAMDDLARQFGKEADPERLAMALSLPANDPAALPEGWRVVVGMAEEAAHGKRPFETVHSAARLAEAQAAKLPVYVLPTELVEFTNHFSRAFGTDEWPTWMQIYRQNALAPWKVSNLGLRPGYWSRNGVTEMFWNWLRDPAVISPGNARDAVRIMRGAEGTMETIQGPKTFKWLREYAGPHLEHQGQFFAEEAEQIAKHAAPTLARKIGKPAAIAMRKMSPYIEDFPRWMQFAYELKHGASVDGAVEMVHAFHINYSRLTPFMHKWGKTIWPFSTFPVGATKIMARETIRQPHKVAGIGRAMKLTEHLMGKATGAPVPPEEYIPDWARSQEPVYGGQTGEGMDRWVPQQNYTPMGQFTDCLLYTSPSPRDRTRSRMPSSA